MRTARITTKPDKLNRMKISPFCLYLAIFWLIVASCSDDDLEPPPIAIGANETPLETLDRLVPAT